MGAAGAGERGVSLSVVAWVVGGAVLAGLLWSARLTQRRADEAQRNLIGLVAEAAREADDRAIADNLDV